MFPVRPHIRFPLAALSAAVLLVMLPTACDSRKSPTSPGPQGVAPVKDAESTALASLDARQDAEQCRTVLQQLDNLDSTRSRPVLSDSERAELTSLFRLTPAEAAEIAQNTFAQTDAAYLEECLLVRAGVRSLKIDARLPPLEKARLGFDWACRMVYVDDRVPWPANPWTTLQAGSGVALSRAYVVLATWQQLGLDGCLIGPPALKTTASMSPESPGEPAKYAPVRACGVKVGSDIFIFDHVGGKAVPAPDGKGVLTLARARAGPDAVAGLAGADEVKTWQPFLAPPLASLGRRMEWLEKLNPAGSGVNLFVDIKSMRAQFAADQPNTPVDGWNPDGDPHTATRVLARYAGEDASTRSKLALRDAHRVRMVPLEAMPQTRLIGEAAAHLKMAFGRGFESLRYTRGSPRDSLVRGLFPEATAALDDVKRALENARTRIEQDKNLQKDFDTWSDEFQALSAKLIRAREREPKKVAAVVEEFDRFRAAPRNRDIEQAFVLGQASRPLGAEVAFLMASCVHERAERAQYDGSARSAEHWRNARDWWERFLDASAQAQSPFPAREAHGRALLARCQQFLPK